MKYLARHAFACLIAIALAAPAIAQTTVRFEDLIGWWSADPVHGGESAHLVLQFVEKDGKQEAQLSAAALGIYDYPLGAATFTGNSLKTSALAISLTWNPDTKTLSGNLPADVVPVYNIPVEFKRSDPFVKPPPRDWKGPRPKVVWSVETGAPVWAGLERAGDGTLFVGNE